MTDDEETNSSEDYISKNPAEENVKDHLNCLSFSDERFDNIEEAQKYAQKLSKQIQDELSNHEIYYPNDYSYITMVEAYSINGPAFASNDNVLIAETDFYVQKKIQISDFILLIFVWGINAKPDDSDEE